ncbi:hypothetical protein ACK1XN_004951, partial [Salmonella enterica]
FVKTNIMNSVPFTITIASSRLYVVRVEAFFWLFDRVVELSDLIPYQKPYQSSTDLCQKLQRDGLVITDVGNAWKVLERCSYYRFKAYLIPFCDETTRRYYPDELLIKRMSYICLIRIYGCWFLIDPKNRNCRA